MDLCRTPATELARLIRSRELSAAELLTAVLARIDGIAASHVEDLTRVLGRTQ